ALQTALQHDLGFTAGWDLLLGPTTLADLAALISSTSPTATHGSAAASPGMPASPGASATPGSAGASPGMSASPGASASPGDDAASAFPGLAAAGLRADGGEAVASFGQERLWLLHQADPGSDAYNVGAAIDLHG